MDDTSTSAAAPPLGPTRAVRPNASRSGQGTHNGETERIIAVARVHPFLAIAPPTLLALFSLGAIVVSPRVWGDAGIFIAWVTFSLGVPLGTLLVIRGILLLTSSRFTLTTGRVIARLALVRRRTHELPLSEVESVEVSQGFVARAVGYGTIVLRGTGGLAFPIWGIRNVLGFQELVQRQVEGAVDRR